MILVLGLGSCLVLVVFGLVGFRNFMQLGIIS